MIARELITMSVRNLTVNKGKTLLTMLGIIIGVTSVVLILSLGAGAQQLVLSQVEQAGSNLVGVIPGGRDEDEQGPPAAAYGIVITTLTYEDAQALRDNDTIPHIVALTPFVNDNIVATYEGVSRSVIASGVSHEYPLLADNEVPEGRFFTEGEVNSLSRVAVLGFDMREHFFEEHEDPIGEMIRLGATNFRVIGVMEKSSSFFDNANDKIFVPVTTAQKILFGISHVGAIRAKVDEPQNIDSTLAQMQSLLRIRHGIKEIGKEDFTIASQQEALATLGGITGALTFFLATIAAISLVVGGIGIMNIMLVTVQERTREIGLRKAVGAPDHAILAQFLIESGLISLVGGLLGTISGAGISFAVALIAQRLEYDWAFIISPSSVALSCGVSIAVGVLFGLSPARHAARMNPITALRYE